MVSMDTFESAAYKAATTLVECAVTTVGRSASLARYALRMGLTIHLVKVLAVASFPRYIPVGIRKGFPEDLNDAVTDKYFLYMLETSNSCRFPELSSGKLGKAQGVATFVIKWSTGLSSTPSGKNLIYCSEFPRA